MSEKQIAQEIETLIGEIGYMDSDDREQCLCDVDGELFDDCQTVGFESSGVMTSNEGFVLRLRDGREYQITVIQSH